MKQNEINGPTLRYEIYSVCYEKTSPSIWVFTVFLYISISLTILPTLSKKIKYFFPLSSIQICFNY